MTNPTEINSPSTEIPVAKFVQAASDEREMVRVVMSLAIIERFSEGLYTSPNKTFEELVSNAYDAGAATVWVYMPRDLKLSTASIVVIDDGTSMDVAGLRNLWKIGESTKRKPDAPSIRGGRSPIGKFGIGKLATYVLANELTYLTSKDGVFRAVTMDYGQVKGEMADPHALNLLVAELSKEEARRALVEALEGMDIDEPPVCVEELFAGEEKSWTAAIMTRLKKPAHDIEQGRLKWVLRTALPLNPGFELWYNDKPLTPSKAGGEIVWRYSLGDRNADPLGPTAPAAVVTTVDVHGVTIPAVQLPNAGRVWGEAVLYKDSLQKGKSEDVGRSHGFFVRVRQRLINLDDPAFGSDVELRHGTFTRFNMVVNADDLDHLVASPRESIQESAELRELRQYLLAIFNKARAFTAAADDSDTMPLLKGQGRISNPPPSLSQGPLRRAVKRAAGAMGSAASEGLGLAPKDVEAADKLVDGNDGLIENVLFEPGQYGGRFVRFDPYRKAAVLNTNHPFVNNYMSQRGAAEPLKLLGLTELLTESYMHDEDIAVDVINRIVKRRDQFLRDLVSRHPRSALVVARHLKTSSNNEQQLEDAVADALDLLGFTVTRHGGTGGTDGIAVARLGRRGGTDSETYALTYDAKSSGREAQDVLTLQEAEAATGTQQKAPRIQAGTTHSSILRVHREKAKQRYNLLVEPKYTLLVAPGFQGDGIDDALINDICKNDGITPVTVADLARLVELFPLRRVTPVMLKEFFECRSPTATRAFVDDLEARPSPSVPPVKLILDYLVKYSERKSPVTIDVLTTAIYERSDGAVDLDSDEANAIVRGLAALAPQSMHFDGVHIAMNAKAENILAELYETLGDYPDRLAKTFQDAIPVVPEQRPGS